MDENKQCNEFQKGRLVERVDQHEVRLDKHDIILDKVRNRLPHWATLLIALLVGIVGWLSRALQ